MTYVPIPPIRGPAKADDALMVLAVYLLVPACLLLLIGVAAWSIQFGIWIWRWMS